MAMLLPFSLSQAAFSRGSVISAFQEGRHNGEWNFVGVQPC